MPSCRFATLPAPSMRPRQTPPAADSTRGARSRAAACSRSRLRAILVTVACVAALGHVSPAGAATVVPTGVINVPTTWGPTGSPYLVQGTVTIQGTATLTILPGVVVEIDNQINPSARIVVGSITGGPGVLSAEGIPAVQFRCQSPASAVAIDFTSNTTSPSRLSDCEFGTTGPGAPIRCTNVGASALNITNCRIMNSAITALTLDNASPNLSGLQFQSNGGSADVECLNASSPSIGLCTFGSSGHEGLRVSGTGVPQLSGCSFTGSGSYAMRVPPASIRSGAFTVGAGYSLGVFVNAAPNSGQGPIVTSTTWPTLPSGRLYQLEGNLYIEGGATLALPAGVRLQGSPGSTIYCGDPANPANGGSLVANGTETQHIVLTSLTNPPWAGISVTNGPSRLQLAYADFSGGGLVTVAGTHAVPFNVTLDRCRLGSGPPWVVQATSGARMVISNSALLPGGVSADVTSDVTATNNWWGASTGPHDASTGPPDYNPGGQGSEVSDFVSYRPFLSQPPCLSPRSITAFAGANGSISPSGILIVPCGSSQSFTITPLVGFAIADVKVDGVSVGAVGSYTFPPSSTQGDHTIVASFLAVNPVSAIAPDTCITSPDSCVRVPVAFDYGGTAPVRLFSVTLALGGGLELCGGISGVTEGPYLASVGATQFYVVDLGSGRYTVDGTILGLPCGATGPGTLFALSVGSSVPTGLGTVTIESVTVRDCTNADILASIGPPATVGIDNLPLTGVSDLVSAQVKSGNGTGGRTGIALTFTPPANAASVEIYRAGYGQYPEFDDAGGGVPAAPSYPPAAPWTLTAVTASGGVDTPGNRDFWYHVMFFKDACGQVSAVSNMTAGSLDYHLGDVSDGITVGTGNNGVGTEDLSALGAHYGANASPGSGFEYLDVGPTTNHSVDARPTTDDQVNFEDLAMFAINFGQVSAPQSRARPAWIAGAGPEQVAVEAPAEVTADETFEAHLNVSGNGRLQMLSVTLGWDGTVVEPREVQPSPWLEAQRGVALSPRAGVVDVALLGARAAGLTGVGGLATIRFHARTAGRPGLRVIAVDGRDAANAAVAVELNTLDVRPVLPSRTSLAAVSPTPSRGAAVLGFTLAQGGRVRLTVHGVDGRRVRTLSDGERPAGEYRVPWDGRDANGNPAAPGLYYARLDAPGVHLTRRVIFVR